jgi:hypothetical protein
VLDLIFSDLFKYIELRVLTKLAFQASFRAAGQIAATVERIHFGENEQDGRKFKTL